MEKSCAELNAWFLRDHYTWYSSIYDMWCARASILCEVRRENVEKWTEFKVTDYHSFHRMKNGKLYHLLPVCPCTTCIYNCIVYDASTLYIFVWECVHCALVYVCMCLCCFSFLAFVNKFHVQLLSCYSCSTSIF